MIDCVVFWSVLLFIALFFIDGFFETHEGECSMIGYAPSDRVGGLKRIYRYIRGEGNANKN